VSARHADKKARTKERHAPSGREGGREGRRGPTCAMALNLPLKSGEVGARRKYSSIKRTAGEAEGRSWRALAV